MFARFTCAEGKDAEMHAALRALVEASTTVEGIEAYSYHQAEDGTYFYYALLSGMEAMQHHNDSPAMQAAMGAFMPLLAGPPDMTMTVPIAVHG
jgi:quinol monooxygenase YgiN